MIKQPIPLTPTEVSVLAQCPLHYHFLKQKSGHSSSNPQAQLDERVREAIQYLHKGGGPARISLAGCLQQAGGDPPARTMIRHYYHRLEQDWPRMMAANESIQLRISIGGVLLLLQGTLDRLDRTSDGGILAILFRTAAGPLPSAETLQTDHAMTIYHALVAATYPLRRPVRLQEMWLQSDHQISIELSEEEYRRNLSDLREPVQALARGEVMARPGLHCDTCPFKHHGCPVYSHEKDAPDQDESENFDLPTPGGKISSRKWIFKI